MRAAKFAKRNFSSLPFETLHVSVMDVDGPATRRHTREQLKEFSVKFRIAIAKNRLTTTRLPR